MASGIEIFRFYGFGNETSSEAPDDFYKVKQQQYSINPSLQIPLLGPLSFTIGPIVKYSKTNLEQDRLISATRPYGSENFGQLGVHVGFRLDMRNRPRAASQGFLINLEGRYFPAVWDVTRGAFGEVHGDASTFLTASSVPLEPTLALRVGGKHVFGTYPFYEAAFIGGGGLTGSTVRGFRAQRFAGDSAIYGNAELRLRLSDIYLFLPGEIGVFGLGDVGRVYLDGEQSKIWHTAYGGGIWISFLEREYCLSIALAKSDERMGIYVSAGFAF
jgi:hemolysin activation/secretion protein